MDLNLQGVGKWLGIPSTKPDTIIKPITERLYTLRQADGFVEILSCVFMFIDTEQVALLQLEDKEGIPFILVSDDPKFNYALRRMRFPSAGRIMRSGDHYVLANFPEVHKNGKRR